MRRFRNWSLACIAFFLLIPLRYNQLATYMFENVYRTCQRQNGVERTGRTWSFPQDWEGRQTECNDTDSFCFFPRQKFFEVKVSRRWAMWTRRCLTSGRMPQRGFVPALEIVLTFSSLGQIFLFLFTLLILLSWFSRYAGEVLPWTCIQSWRRRKMRTKICNFWSEEKNFLRGTEAKAFRFNNLR